MTTAVDILLVLDGDDVVRTVQCADSRHSDLLGEEFRPWVGTRLDDVPGAAWDHLSRTLRWRNRSFLFERFQISGAVRCVALRLQDRKRQLMEAALNTIEDGIQLYGPDSEILFLNRASKNLLEIPQDQDMEGQLLLDIFDVDADYSTTLTALRNRSPVRSRFDTYKSTTGKGLVTVTSAYPVLENGELLGCVSLERDMGIAKKTLSEFNQLQQTLVSHLPSPLSQSRDTRYTLDDMIGDDPQLRATIDLAARMAPRENSILIQGETGTGKEILAQGIHALSSRRNEKFIAVNCAAFPETLIEGMLFGTAKGAFTGSVDRVGLIELANQGTLFLDELNSMSLPMQSKLLRVFQEHTLQRVGSTVNIPINVRLISSCNENAFELTEQGRLRKDLFYRVASVILTIPPLRDRMEDLEKLTWYYIRHHQRTADQPITSIEPAYWRRLRQHSWPGNVRELFHILDYSMSVAADGVLREKDFPAYFQPQRKESVHSPLAAAEPVDFRRGLSQLVDEYEKHILESAYLACDRNATRTAQLLKISRQNCQYYIKKYGFNQSGSPK